MVLAGRPAAAAEVAALMRNCVCYSLVPGYRPV